MWSLLFQGSWHHIQNLDTFFTNISFVPSCGSAMEPHSLGRENLRVQWPCVCGGVTLGQAHCPLGFFLDSGHIYNYHQRNGFTCILLEDIFQLG